MQRTVQHDKLREAIRVFKVHFWCRKMIEGWEKRCDCQWLQAESVLVDSTWAWYVCSIAYIDAMYVLWGPPVLIRDRAGNTSYILVTTVIKKGRGQSQILLPEGGKGGQVDG